MKNNQHEKIQSALEKKEAKRIKKKTIKMKMSGQQVKNLQRIIIEHKNKSAKRQSLQFTLNLIPEILTIH